ncbi:MAG: hypothetical protein M1834_009461 [Cirrosporium novae-zelandiae]|nr:MAG: hypothetical protein M1834_009461 [Cirrosporium novae-zelandiae]
MVSLSKATHLFFWAGVAFARAAPKPTPGPDMADVEKRATSCTFTAASQVSKSASLCSTITISAITVPSATTLDLTGLADDTKVVFKGTTTFDYAEWDGPLISVAGTGITVEGASGHVINGNGAAWWDGDGSNGGVTKPKFFYAHKMYDSVIAGLNIKNTPVQCFSIDNSESLVIENVIIDNSDGDTDELGHNTDAFDIGDSTYITIKNPTVYNQDDCVAINSGTYITFTGGTCSGGHGLSIGSVGGRSDNTVENVYIEGVTVTDSTNGVRVKTVYDATGTVYNVTYKDITLSGISDYGIVVEQDYENGSPTGTPTNGVTISDLVLNGITGTVDSSCVEVYILCGDGSCTDWTYENIDISGGTTSDDCENVPEYVSC